VHACAAIWTGRQIKPPEAAAVFPRSKQRTLISTIISLNTTPTTNHLVSPHGGKLINLLLNREQAADTKAASRDFPSWDLTPRQLCDLELLLNGGFSPLTGFMNRDDYEAVCNDMHLVNGLLWPMPITLDVSEALAKTLKPGSTKVALRDPEGVMIALLHVEDVWQPDRQAEAKSVFKTTSQVHPTVAYLTHRSHPWYVGGRLEGLQLPSHYDFKTLRHTPAELRSEFANAGWRRVVAFQTRNPMHRAHVELTFRAAKQIEASLLIHPVVGMTKPGDVDYFTRVRCYQLLVGKYPAGTAKLALVPFAMRMGGPREAIWHALIRKNYGCTHLIIGRDHAGPGQRQRWEAVLRSLRGSGTVRQARIGNRCHSGAVPNDGLPRGQG
jgi:sulfate adenylyltransferase